MTKRERESLKKAIACFVDEHEGGWAKGMAKLQAMLRADAKRRQRLAAQNQRPNAPSPQTPNLFAIQARRSA